MVWPLWWNWMRNFAKCIQILVQTMIILCFVMDKCHIMAVHWRRGKRRTICSKTIIFYEAFARNNVSRKSQYNSSRILLTQIASSNSKWWLYIVQIHRAKWNKERERGGAKEKSRQANSPLKGAGVFQSTPMIRLQIDICCTFLCAFRVHVHGILYNAFQKPI